MPILSKIPVSRPAILPAGLLGIRPLLIMEVLFSQRISIPALIAPSLRLLLARQLFRKRSRSLLAMCMMSAFGSLPCRVTARFFLERIFAGVLLLSGAGSGAGYNEYNYTGLAAGTGVISFSFARDDAFELDDISVTDVTPAGVPDAASTAGLLGLGLAGLLALRRRLGLPSSCPKTGS